MKNAIIILLASILPGCTCIARDTETYKKDTRSVLETKNDGIKSCYDSALAANPAQSGSVVVTFIVEKKTGTITNVAADPNKSTAPEGLQQCVVTALEGLVLDPPDQREGQATFTWTFSGPSGEGKPTEPPAEAPAEAPPAGG
jgi:hypothetical protein